MSFIYWELVLRSNLKLSNHENHHNHIASTKITIVASTQLTVTYFVPLVAPRKKKTPDTLEWGKFLINKLYVVFEVGRNQSTPGSYQGCVWNQQTKFTCNNLAALVKGER